MRPVMILLCGAALLLPLGCGPSALDTTPLTPEERRKVKEESRRARRDACCKQKQADATACPPRSVAEGP